MNSEQALYKAILALQTPDEAQRFFNDLCTPSELEALADRWRVVAPIKEGMSYRKIQEKTGVSVTTVGRVARNISHGHGGYNLIFNRLVNREKHND